MQPEKLHQRFEHAEDTIAELAQTCASRKDVSDTLEQSTQQLDDQARQYHSCLEGARDPQTLVEAIDKLEACSDHAKTACQNVSGKVNHSTGSAVMRAHEELSQPEHKLH